MIFEKMIENIRLKRVFGGKKGGTFYLKISPKDELKLIFCFSNGKRWLSRSRNSLIATFSPIKVLSVRKNLVDIEKINSDADIFDLIFDPNMLYRGKLKKYRSVYDKVGDDEFVECGVYGCVHHKGSRFGILLQGDRLKAKLLLLLGVDNKLIPGSSSKGRQWFLKPIDFGRSILQGGE